ncbi:MAG: M16 family metallopeptidase [Alphaproteobacteria bacterium]
MTRHTLLLNNYASRTYHIYALIVFAFLTVIALPFGLAQAESAEPDKVFDAKTITLDNGMTVVVVENHRAPVVTHMVWYRVGAADEPRGKSGIAHFMEHLMFKGSEGLEPGEFSRIVRNLGGNDNAFTSQDYTAYFQSIATEHLETVMRMEAGRMRGMNPPPEEVDSERKVILEERRQRTDNNPRAQFGETMNAAFFVNHPYGRPVIGWAHEMETLSRKDAMSFYDQWYAPNNAVLVVSGGVEAEKVFDLAEKIYGVIEKRDIATREYTKTPPLLGRNIINFTHPNIHQPVYQRLFRAPSSRQNRADALALQVLEDIVGRGSTSRLYRSLVINQKLATSAGLNYSGTAWDDGTIAVFASPAEGVEMDALETALNEELRKLIDEGVSAEELSDSLKRLQAEAIFARDSLTGPAMIIGYALVTGSTLDEIENWPRDIAKVTAEDVQNAARRYLDITNPDVRFVTGHLLPEPRAANNENTNENEGAQE